MPPSYGLLIVGSVFCWLYCFKTAHIHALVAFHIFRVFGFATRSNRDGFVRFYVRALKVFGAVWIAAAAFVVISGLIG